MLRPLATFPISKVTLDLLNKNGLYYWEDVVKAPEVAKNFINLDEIGKLGEPPEAVLALDHWQEELLCERVTTCNKALDALLDGGFHCKSITEICGAQGTGKTQICFQLCVTTQLSQERGGLNGKVLFIDTRNGFSSLRLLDLVRGLNKDNPNLKLRDEDVLRNITVVTVVTAKELFVAVQSIKEYLKKNSCIRVIIIDSLSFPVLSSIPDTSIKAEYFFKILTELQSLASQFNIAIIIVNELVTHLDSKGNIGISSAGGQAVAHRAQKRLLFARLNDTLFAAKILKSPIAPQTSKAFQITVDGIKDQ